MTPARIGFIITVFLWLVFFALEKKFAREHDKENELYFSLLKFNTLFPMWIFIGLEEGWW